jgi:predicted porin
MSLAGAAFAQSTVSVSGKLAFAYASVEGAGANPPKANGLAVTDGDFVLTASEDLGGGLKATASMAVQSRGRDTAVAGRDASISLAGGFGSLTIGAIEIGNGIIGLGGADAPTIGMDGANGVVGVLGGVSRAVLSAAMNLDVLMYTSPAMGGFTVSAALLDSTPINPLTLAATNSLGMGSTSTSVSATLLGANYAAGALAAAADYTKFNNNLSNAGLDYRTRLSASYDLGVAKLGAGYETIKTTAVTNNTQTQFLLGVSAPVGKALTVGANYAKNTQDGSVDVSGYELGVNYALSKRTGVQVAYQNLSESTANGVAAITGSATTFRVRLMHSF